MSIDSMKETMSLYMDANNVTSERFRMRHFLASLFWANGKKACKQIFVDGDAIKLKAIYAAYCGEVEKGCCTFTGWNAKKPGSYNAFRSLMNEYFIFVRFVCAEKYGDDPER